MPYDIGSEYGPPESADGNTVMINEVHARCEALSSHSPIAAAQRLVSVASSRESERGSRPVPRRYVRVWSSRSETNGGVHMVEVNVW